MQCQSVCGRTLLFPTPCQPFSLLPLCRSTSAGDQPVSTGNYPPLSRQKSIFIWDPPGLMMSIVNIWFPTRNWPAAVQWPRLPHYKHAWCCCSPGDLVGGCRATSLYQHQPCAAAAELPSLPALRTHNYPTCSNILFGRSKISHLLHWLKAHMRVASIFHLKSSGKNFHGQNK